MLKVGCELYGFNGKFKHELTLKCFLAAVDSSLILLTFDTFDRVEAIKAYLKRKPSLTQTITEGFIA